MGLDIHKYDLPIHSISANTIKEQQAKIEKICLVAFLNKDQRQSFVNLGGRLKKNDKDFTKIKTFTQLYLALDQSKKRLRENTQKNSTIL